MMVAAHASRTVWMKLDRCKQHLVKRHDRACALQQLTCHGTTSSRMVTLKAQGHRGTEAAPVVRMMSCQWRGRMALLASALKSGSCFRKSSMVRLQSLNACHSRSACPHTPQHFTSHYFPHYDTIHVGHRPCQKYLKVAHRPTAIVY